MDGRIHLRVCCRLKSKAGSYSARATITLNDGPPIELEVSVSNPEEPDLRVGVRHGERVVIDLEGDRNADKLEEPQRLLLFLLCDPLLDTTRKIDTLNPGQAELISTATETLAEATGFAEFLATTERTYEAGEREMAMMRQVLDA